MNKGLKLVVEEAAEPRRPVEYQVLLAATLVTIASERPVKLRTLAPTGAQIEGMNLPRQGADVILKRGALEIFATVIWSAGRRCTLEFENELTDEQVLDQIKPLSEIAAADPREADVEQSELVEQDRRRAARWPIPAGRLV